MIGSVANDLWFACTGDELVMNVGLSSASVSMASPTQTIHFCDAAIRNLSTFYDVACTSGRAALGLGITGIILTAFGALFSILLTTSYRRGAFWSAALVTQLTGGILGLAGGAAYMGRMNHKADDAFPESVDCSSQSGPILLLVGQSQKIKERHTYFISTCDSL